MAGVYSTRFLDSGTHPPPGVQTYVVPAGRTAVIRNIDVYMAGGQWGGGHTANWFEASHVITGTIFYALSGNQFINGMWYWEGRQILYASEVLSIFTEIPQIKYTVNGFLLTTP